MLEFSAKRQSLIASFKATWHSFMGSWRGRNDFIDLGIPLDGGITQASQVSSPAREKKRGLISAALETKLFISQREREQISGIQLPLSELPPVIRAAVEAAEAAGELPPAEKPKIVSIETGHRPFALERTVDEQFPRRAPVIDLQSWRAGQYKKPAA